MVLFLSHSFLRRLQLVWKPSLQGFLIGERNLFFFIPDTFLEAPEISPSTVDGFLNEVSLRTHWQLLGFLAPAQLSSVPGYLQVNTNGVWDAAKWVAHVSLLEAEGARLSPVEIRKGREF
jgi:hypothetical protein